MSQGRAISALEAITNVTLGWILALGTQLLVFPVMGLSVTVAQHLGIGAAFTAVSFARSYLLRRLFEHLGTGQTPGGGSISTRWPMGPTRGGKDFCGRNSDRGSRVMTGQGR